MGLLTILRKIKQKEREMRILVVGLDNAGKSTILYSFEQLQTTTEPAQQCDEVADMIGNLNLDHAKISPTVGFQIKSFLHKAGYLLTIWDIGGQRSIRPYWRNHYAQTDALVFVIDGTDRERLLPDNNENVVNAGEDQAVMSIGSTVLETMQQVLGDDRTGGASLLIMVNKSDVSGAMTPAQVQQALQLDKWLKGRNYKIAACSAYTGQGITEGFDWIVKDVSDRLYHNHNHHHDAARVSGASSSPNQSEELSHKG
ncbi:hypothetical protein MP228_002113 [Amoeboaphelidium protococcarum]|nr:hypothetical protein MP228_002113 [Amoeboaphelidium protococcarum]